MNTRIKVVNYRALSDVKLPRVKGKTHAGGTDEDKRELFALEVIERDNENRRVKVHYIGYSDDEWRDAHDIVDLM